MGFFSKKNPNESAYTGGKKHWADVIKNTGIGGDLVWRQPEEDFNTNSTLIVMPGEQAVFIKGGNIEEIFDSGTYKLSTENYPFISRLRNAFTGGISVFNCLVFFVRTATSVEIRWGTDGPIQVRDKILGIQTELKARGSYRVKIGNAGKFLQKFLGNGINTLAPEELERYFGKEFLAEIKTTIAGYVNDSNTEIIGIAGRQREIAQTIEPTLREALDDYGIELLKFSISAIDVDDNELRRRYDEIGMDAIGKIRNAQADKGVMDILGQNWQAQKQMEIMSQMAQNQGETSMGAAMGMGMAAAQQFFGMSQQQMQNATSATPPPLPVQFHVYIGGRQIGPIDMRQLQQYAQSGQLDRDTLVWRAGMPDWAAAGTIPELGSLFTTPPQPPVPPTTPVI